MQLVTKLIYNQVIHLSGLLGEIFILLSLFVIQCCLCLNNWVNFCPTGQLV